MAPRLLSFIIAPRAAVHHFTVPDSTTPVMIQQRPKDT